MEGNGKESFRSGRSRRRSRDCKREKLELVKKVMTKEIEGGVRGSRERGGWKLRKLKIDWCVGLEKN